MQFENFSFPPQGPIFSGGHPRHRRPHPRPPHPPGPGFPGGPTAPAQKSQATFQDQTAFMGGRGVALTTIQGYGLDLNGNGKFDGLSGGDGTLAFDFNKDGLIDWQEVQMSNEALKAARSGQPNSLDSNGDGKLDARELSSARARVVTGTGYDPNSALGWSPVADPTGPALTELDLRTGRATTSQTPGVPSAWSLALLMQGR